MGDTAHFQIAFDPIKWVIPMHSKLAKALNDCLEDQALFDGFRTSLQLEIVIYISFLKTEATIDKNVLRTLIFYLEMKDS